ncbi:ribosome-recycling factor [Buchnera aphidicola (Pseudoregma panicola)]|uniref:ribosome-recycling factor n=1 Tax=Buchnera aphidicola TaxID=9 RepID=UPI0031B69CC5
MINYAKNYATKKMIFCIDCFKKKVDLIRAGVANISLIENIKIECYGKKVFLNKISRIIVHNNRTLKINLFDESLKNNVINSISKSNIGLTSYEQNNNIFVSVPFLTKEKRIQLIKFVYKEGENAKIDIRIIRRDINTKFNNMYLDKKINKDDKYRIEKIVQNITNDFIKNIDCILTSKKFDLENS